MEITGKLVSKKATEQITDTFKKREFVIEYAENPEYPELIKFELINDKCDIIKDYAKDQVLTVGFNLRGRKWTNPKGEDVYFNTLNAWKVNASDGAFIEAPVAETPVPKRENTPQEDMLGDIPF
jgi:hypothetical protein